MLSSSLILWWFVLCFGSLLLRISEQDGHIFGKGCCSSWSSKSWSSTYPCSPTFSGEQKELARVLQLWSHSCQTTVIVHHISACFNVCRRQAHVKEPVFFSWGDHVKIVKGIPSILAVLEEPRWCFKHVLSVWTCKLWEDMGGQKPEVEHLKMSGDGMEMSGDNGYLLLPCWIYDLKLLEQREEIRTAVVRLPSISAAVLEKEFSKVIFSIQLNSNAYNQGLIADCTGTIDESSEIVWFCEALELCWRNLHPCRAPWINATFPKGEGHNENSTSRNPSSWFVDVPWFSACFVVTGIRPGDLDQSGIPKFVYNGFGLSDKKNSNAIKRLGFPQIWVISQFDSEFLGNFPFRAVRFHPGMGGGLGKHLKLCGFAPTVLAFDEHFCQDSWE